MLVGALLLIIYAFIGVNFIWIDSFNSIKEGLTELDKLTEEKESLDSDVVNIKVLKSSFEDKKNALEQMNQYVADKVNVIDGATYLNKVSMLQDKVLTKYKIESPEIVNMGFEDKTKSKAKRNTNTTEATDESKGTYFDLSIEFTTNMKYKELDELLKIIEGSMRKAVIKELELSPVTKTGKDKNDTPTNSDEFVVKMKLAIFSTGDGDSALSDFERFKYSKQIESDKVPYNPGGLEAKESEPEKTEKTGEKGTKTPETADSNVPEKTPDTTNAETTSKDISMFDRNTIDMYQVGYHVAGHNVRIYGIEREKKNILLKSKHKLDVILNLKGSYYSIDVADNNGRLDSISGSLPLKDIIVLNLNIEYENTSVDKDMGMNLNIINESDKKINVNLKDKIGKTLLFDRNGKKIIGKSSIENLSFT